MNAPRQRVAAQRLFLALWPDDAVRRALAGWRDRCRWPEHAAVVADARLHLTLHFIGSVAADRLGELRQGLRVSVRPFDLVLDRCTAWPHGLALLEPANLPDELFELHAALGSALRALQLPVERRRYRPHVTLARRADGATLHRAVDPLRWRADRYALVRSHDAAARGYEVLWDQGVASAGHPLE